MLGLHEEYGPVVSFGIGPTRAVAVFGPEANEFVLAHDDHFRGNRVPTDPTLHQARREAT